MRTPPTIARIAIVMAIAMVAALIPGSAMAWTPNYGWLLLRATNQSRLSHHVPMLDRASRMSEYAQRHTELMARDGRLWHTSGPTRYDAHCFAWGENIGYTTGSIADLQRAFMKSASHRSHILNSRFDRVAVGAAKVGRRLWVTVFFCT
jgi:uncharacterized protein YkwD